jgi:hypothetical protein
MNQLFHFPRFLPVVVKVEAQDLVKVALLNGCLNFSSAISPGRAFIHQKPA